MISVIASIAKQSSLLAIYGLLRYARNDDKYVISIYYENNSSRPVAD